MGAVTPIKFNSHENIEEEFQADWIKFMGRK